MKHQPTKPPIITIDGPSGSGKGTISQRVAEKLNWHFLDSGAVYRILALAVIQEKVAATNESAIVDLAHSLDARFLVNPVDTASIILLNGIDVSHEIRTELCGEMASKIASLASVRQALLARQREFAKMPGLVADGRDMGTVVFPHAVMKIFLDATPEERANRRYKQLKKRGIDANLAQILTDLKARDERDRNRLVAPLRPAIDAILIDTTCLSIDEVKVQVLLEAAKRHLA
jgi:cytidylate kinase